MTTTPVADRNRAAWSERISVISVLSKGCLFGSSSTLFLSPTSGARHNPKAHLPHRLFSNPHCETNNAPKRTMATDRKVMKLTYFDLTGRGEPIRLALWIGGVKFEESRIEFKDWPKLKPETKYGSLPVLDLPTGENLAQTRAIARYVGKVAGLYPKDPIAAAMVDEIIDTCEDIQSAVMAAGRGMEKTEKEKARLEAITSGQPAKLLKILDSFVTPKGYMVGDSITLADLFVFAYTGFVTSGFFDGVPKDAMKNFPKLQTVRKAVASHPAVIKRYEAEKSTNPAYKEFASVKDL